MWLFVWLTENDCSDLGHGLWLPSPKTTSLLKTQLTIQLGKLLRSKGFMAPPGVATETLRETKRMENRTKCWTLPQLCNHKYNKIWSAIADLRHCSSGRKTHGYRTRWANTDANEALVGLVSVRSEVSQITCMFLGDLWGLESGCKLLTGEPHTDTSALCSLCTLERLLGCPSGSFTNSPCLFAFLVTFCLFNSFSSFWERRLNLFFSFFLLLWSAFLYYHCSWEE